MPSVEDALINLLRQNKEGIEAERLREQLEELGYSGEDVRWVIRRALNRGSVQLGREMKLALEAA